MKTSSALLERRPFFSSLHTLLISFLLAFMFGGSRSSAAPGPTTLITPSGTVTQETPVFDWSSVTGSTWYQIYLSRNGQFFYSQWIKDLDFWIPTWNFQNYPGEYTWWIQTWGDGQAGPWSGPLTFSVPTRTPGTSTLISPVGGVQVAAAFPSFAWSESDPEATWYQIWLSRDGVFFDKHWLEGTNSWSPAYDLRGYPGSYQWWIQTWNPHGLGPWSMPASFSVPSRAPGAPTLSGPEGTLTDPYPVHSWSEVAGSEWYQIWINRNGGKFYSLWIEGQSATSWTPHWNVLDYPGAYQWWVQGWNQIGKGGPWSSPLSYRINDTGETAIEQRTFSLINQYRASNSLAPFVWNESIAVACRTHSGNMASGSVTFGHGGFEQRCSTLRSQVGGTACAENVAWNQGYADPAYEAYIAWLNSAGHKANIDGNFTMSGMGVVKAANNRYYFTQIFMR